MTPADAALREFARRRKLRVRPCNVSDANVGRTARLQVIHWHQDRKFTIYAAEDLLAITAALEHQALLFAVNAPDRVMGLSLPLEPDGQPEVFVDSTGTSKVLVWFADTDHRRLVDALGLGPAGSLQVCRNGATAVVAAEADLDNLVVHLHSLCRHLPLEPATAPEIALEDLPVDLRPLARYFHRWAASDDAVREERLARAKPAAIRTLLATVAPLLPRIDEYLATFRDQPLSETALRLASLAEVVAELRAREV